MNSTDAIAEPGFAELINKRISGFEAALSRSWFAVNDIYALHLLQPLLTGAYTPYTNAAIRPASMAFLLNEVVINARRTILEFGMGISTLLIGRLIRANRIDARLISVEHDGSWKETMDKLLAAEHLADIVTTVHAPLSPCPLTSGPNHWYDCPVLQTALLNKKFDMVIVDGPPAYKADKKEARYPALPFIFGFLAERSIICLDNADREGEKNILKRWSEEFSLRFGSASGSMSYAYIGDHFNAQL